MNSRIAAALFFGTATAVAVAASLHPLNVKTGLWQMTETTTWTGLPPQLAVAMANSRTHQYRSCVTKADLSTNPWSGGSGESCKWTVLNSTGTDMELRGTACDMGKELGLTAQVHGKIHVLDSEHGVGSFDVTMVGSGQTMNGHASYTGKWVRAGCPAE